MHRIWRVSLFLVVLAFGWALPAVAQRSDCPDFTTVLDYGDEAEGEITDDESFVFYCFDGREGDEIVVTLEATRGDLDTFILLGDIDLENFFADNDDARSGTTDSLLEYTLEEDASYILVAARVDGTDGRTEGEFRLTLENGSGSRPNPDSDPREEVAGGQCGAGSNILIAGYEQESSLDDDNFLRAYCFYGIEGSEYRIDVEATSDDLDTTVFVASLGFEEVFDENDNASSRTTDSRLEFTPEEDAIYMIVVSREGLDEGRTSGGYRVSLENRTTGEPEGCPAVFTIPRGGLEIGRIDETFMHVFCFDAERGDDVTFTAEAQRGDLDMVAFISEPDMSDIEQVESQRETLEVSADIPADGPYLVIVFDLTGAGRFNVALDGNSGSDGSSSNSNSPSNQTTSTGDCDQEPLLFLIEGEWAQTSREAAMEFDFACEGEVTVTVNNRSFDTTYTLEGDVLTIALNDGDLVIEGLLLTRTALIGSTDGQAFMLINRAR